MSSGIDDAGRRVKIYTRSMNKVLYDKAMGLVDLPYPRERLLNTTADGYLYEVIADDSADYVINIDEDAFVVNSGQISALLDHFIEGGYINAGMPDGGVLPIRSHNPVVTNPFFTIMHTERIREIFDLDEVKNFSLDEKPAFPQPLQKLIRTEWVWDDFEPYSQFYVWLSRQGDTLYLDAREHSDGITTELLDHRGDPFLLHTCYSRHYGAKLAHTRRINAINDQAVRASGRGEMTSLSERVHLGTSILGKVSRSKVSRLTALVERIGGR